MKKTLSALYILIAAALWGCIGLFYKQLANIGFSQLQVVFLRVFTAAVLMAIYMLIRDPSWFKIRFRDCWMFIGTGIISLAFFNYCYFSAMDELSVSVAATLLYTAPIFVMLISAVLFHEKMTVVKLIAVVLTFIGCILVTGALTGGHITAVGMLYGLGSGIGYALYTIFSVYALRRYKTETITFYTFLFASVSVFLICRPLSMFNLFCAAPSTSTVYTLCIGLLACLLPYLLYTKGLSGVSAGQASIMATLEPVVATLVGCLIFQESMTLPKIMGIVLIVGSILFLNFKKIKNI